MGVFLVNEVTPFKNRSNLSELHGPSLLLAGDNESQEVNGVLRWLLPALRCRQQTLALADPSPRLSKTSSRSSALFPLPVDVKIGSLSLESCSEENDLIPNSPEVWGMIHLPCRHPPESRAAAWQRPPTQGTMFPAHLYRSKQD